MSSPAFGVVLISAVGTFSSRLNTIDDDAKGKDQRKHRYEGALFT